MNETTEKCIARIEEEIKGEEYTTIGGCGLQVIEILKHEPQNAQLVWDDLEAGHGIKECEKKIHEFADEQHRKNKAHSVGISMSKAEEIIRKFFGLPEKETDSEPAQEIGPILQPMQASAPEEDAFSLENFL